MENRKSVINKRLHLGVLLSTLEDKWQNDTWRGIAEYAAEKDIHLTAYFGAYQTSNYVFSSHYETCLEAINNNDLLDGIIVFGKFIAQDAGVESLKKCVKKLPRHIPIVSVSYTLPGIPAVYVNSNFGMYSMVAHLIKHHGKKKIAFVNGPGGHPAARERLLGYQRALTENGIAFDEKYVLPGDFASESGRLAAAEIIDTRKLDIDAIAVSNDEAASGVINELKARGVCVPEDVLVTGFDDVRVSWLTSPSISTVRQDYFELGRLSAEMLWDKINNLPVERAKYLTPVLVPRQSCGCFKSRLSTEEPGFADAIRLRDQHIRAYEANDLRTLIRRISNNLVLMFDIDSLAEELCKSLPDISINTAFIFLYRTHIKSGELNADRTIDFVTGFDGEIKFDIKNIGDSSIKFAEHFTINGFDYERKRRELFFLPLFFKDEELGIAILSFAAQIPIDAYETLRVDISAAIKGAALISKIRELSVTDELTGLLNRRGFFQFTDSRTQHLHWEKDIIPIVLFIDLDGLKIINDTYGHSEGDTALIALAKILQDTLRDEDIVGRVGGDEFVVFSAVKTKENAKQLESRIRARIAEYNARSSHPYNISCSMGSAVLNAANKECFDMALSNADSFLYEEKMAKKKHERLLRLVHK